MAEVEIHHLHVNRAKVRRQVTGIKAKDALRCMAILRDVCKENDWPVEDYILKIRESGRDGWTIHGE